MTTFEIATLMIGFGSLIISGLSLTVAIIATSNRN